jgi:biopolymer transport protein TolR
MAATGKRGRRLMGEINVVPYIDVMLVLLIIFMVTAPLLTQGVQVDLPKAAASPVIDQKHQPLVVSIDREGRWYLNVGDHKSSPIEEAALSEGVRVVLGRDADTPVLLKADQAIPYGTVVRTMVLLQHAGATRIGFLTDPPNARAVGRTVRN